MAELVAAGASSHAFAIENPSGWDQRRQRNRENYEKRFGDLPPEQPDLESDDVLMERAGRFREGLDVLRRGLAESNLDTLVVVADDQDEAFTDGNFPQFAIYLGGDFTARGLDRRGPGRPCRSDERLAAALYQGLVDRDIDVMSVQTLPDRFLPSHAFGPFLEVIDPVGRFKVVPVFVNAVHMPAPSPARCHALGRALGEAVRDYEGGERVAVTASGGLSHFPASYPAGHFGDGKPFPWGWIDADFDRWTVERLREGDAEALTRLTSADLIRHGSVELRSWIALLGAVGSQRPATLVYEPILRGITGMGVGFWQLT